MPLGGAGAGARVAMRNRNGRKDRTPDEWSSADTRISRGVLVMIGGALVFMVGLILTIIDIADGDSTEKLIVGVILIGVGVIILGAGIGLYRTGRKMKEEEAQDYTIHQNPESPRHRDDDDKF